MRDGFTSSHGLLWILSCHGEGKSVCVNVVMMVMSVCSEWQQSVSQAISGHVLNIYSSCRTFFKRSIISVEGQKKHEEYKACKQEINCWNKKCRKCRFNSCLAAGMTPRNPPAVKAFHNKPQLTHEKPVNKKPKLIQQPRKC